MLHVTSLDMISFSTDVRRKFGSYSSDNMDRWKGTAMKKLRHGDSQKGEDQSWRRSEREKVRRMKMQVGKKVGKSRNTVFPMFCGSGGSKSRLISFFVRTIFQSHKGRCQQNSRGARLNGAKSFD